MHATSRRLAALLSVVLLAAVCAPVAQASSNSQTRGLFDGLGGVIGGVLGGLTSVLNGLLGPTQLAPLTSLTSSLTPGSAPSAQTLAPLTNLVQGVATSSSSPADLKNQATSVLAILNSGGTTPLPDASLNQITGLLGTLALTQGLTGDQVSVLNGLVSALQSAAGAATGGLPIVGGIDPGVGGLPVGTNLITSLSDLVIALTAGQVPTGASLAPVTALLREVAAALPAPLSTTIIELADAIDQTVGTLGADLLGPLTTVLGQIAGTAGVSPAVATQLAPLAAAIQRGSTPGIVPISKPGRVLYAAAKVSTVKVDRKKGRLVVRVVCQSIVNKCATILTPLRGKSAAGKAVLVMIPAGGAVTRKLALSSGVKRLMKRKTVKLVVVGTSQRGTTNRKAVTTKVPKPRKAH